MNTHLPSFIISETPNGVLYRLGYLFTPGVGAGLLAATPNGALYGLGYLFTPGDGAGLFAATPNNEKQKKMTTFATTMLQMRHLANDERNDDVRIRTRVRS